MTERRRIKNRPEPLGPDGLTASERAEGYVLISKPGAILRVLSRPHTAAEREALNIGSARLPPARRAEDPASLSWGSFALYMLSDPLFIVMLLLALFETVYGGWLVFNAR